MTIFPSPKGDVEIGPYRPGDEHAILALFKLVFNVDRSMAVWNWQFRDCPQGIHAFVGRLADGTIVSQFTGLPVKTKVGQRKKKKKCLKWLKPTRLLRITDGNL
jgi:hypothetical protein